MLLPPLMMAVPPLSDAQLNAALGAFEGFQAARIDFAQELGRLAATGRDAATMRTGGGGSSGGIAHEVGAAEKVLAALQGSDTLAEQIGALVSDVSPSVVQSAMISLGRLCLLSHAVCTHVLSPAVLQQLAKTLAGGGSAPLLKAAHFLCYAGAQGSADAARALVGLGVLEHLVENLEAAGHRAHTHKWHARAPATCAPCSPGGRPERKGRRGVVPRGDGQARRRARARGGESG